MKREIYTVRWGKKATLDRPKGYYGWIFSMDGTCWPMKESCERHARYHCRARWEMRGVPCQLRIYTKAGRIGKGGRYEASYGCDSKRRRG